MIATSPSTSGPVKSSARPGKTRALTNWKMKTSLACRAPALSSSVGSQVQACARLDNQYPQATRRNRVIGFTAASMYRKFPKNII